MMIDGKRTRQLFLGMGSGAMLWMAGCPVIPDPGQATLQLPSLDALAQQIQTFILDFARQVLAAGLL